MSECTKGHPINNNQNICKIVIEIPNKKNKQAFLPIEYIDDLKKFLKDHQSEELKSWEKLAKERIDKHKKSGLVLRGARFREGLSQKELSKLSGITQENISKMENGNRKIGEKVAKRLANALNINYDLLTSCH